MFDDPEIRARVRGAFQTHAIRLLDDESIWPSDEEDFVRIARNCRLQAESQLACEAWMERKR